MTTHARTAPPSTELDLPLLPKNYEWRVRVFTYTRADSGASSYTPKVELWRRKHFSWQLLDSDFAMHCGDTERECIEYTARRIANRHNLTPATPVPDEIAQYIGTYARKEN